jgi:hypothetical protein
METTHNMLSTIKLMHFREELLSWILSNYTFMNAKKILCYVLLFVATSVSAQIDDTTDRQAQEIDGVVISSSPKQIVFEDSKYFIIDFSVNETGTFVLLKHLRDYYIYSLDEGMNLKTKLKLDFKPQSFYVDCRNDVHLFSKDFFYQLSSDGASLAITDERSLEEYHVYYENCIATSEQKFFIRSLENVNQSTLYFAVDKTLSSYDLLCRIEDSVRVNDLLRETAEIKSTAPNGQFKSAEVSVANLQKARDQFEREMFFEFVLSQPGYNPLFVKNDTTFIFDHINGNVLEFSDSGNQLKSTPIDYHLNKNWAEINHFDPKRNEFYTVMERNGAQYFVKFAEDDFSSRKETKITEHSYPKKLVVYDGYVYYAHKPDYNSNLNKLYRQRL